jgi:hypothetical protein
MNEVLLVCDASCIEDLIRKYLVVPEYCLLPQISLLNWTCMTRSEWASWFQAIASVVAISIAIVVPAVQHRRDVKMRIQEGHGKIAYALRLTYRIAEDFQRWLVIFKVNEDHLFDSVGMQDLRHRIAQIDLQNLPPPLADQVSQLWFSLVQVSAMFQRPDGTSSFERENPDHKQQVEVWNNGADHLSHRALRASGDLMRAVAAWPTIPPQSLIDWVREPDRKGKLPISRRQIEHYLIEKRRAAGSA